MINKGMGRKEFDVWKKEWFLKVPKCKDFVCCHELMSCAIHPLCGCGGIYETYKSQKNPEECTTVSCQDCMLKYDCEKVRGIFFGDEVWCPKEKKHVMFFEENCRCCRYPKCDIKK